MQTGKTALLGQAINPRLKKKRIRHLLKQFPVMSQILGFVGVKESFSKVARLNRLTNSKKFRTEALDACIWRATVQGLTSQDRCWLILTKTKLRRIMKLNYEGFYWSQFKNPAKMKYDCEIEKDLKRTFPNQRAFQEASNLQMLRRILNVLCLQNEDQIGYVQGMNFVAAMFMVGLKMHEEASFWGLI